MHHPFEQRSVDWFAVRRGKITASIAGAVLGVDPHRGPYYAYQEIIGAHKTVERYGGGTSPQNWGVEKEAEARECFERETGLPIDLCGFHTHPDHDFLGASPDGLCGVSAVLEIKCPIKEFPERVPVHHRVQCLLQMACTGRSVAFYYAWTPEKSRLWVVRPAGTESLIRRLKVWFDAHVATGTPPPRRVPGRKKRRKPEPEPAMNHAFPFGGDYEA